MAVEEHGAAKAIKILDGVSANNGQPSGTSVGIAVNEIAASAGAVPASCSIQMYGTASGTGSLSARVWGYSSPLSQWLPLGTGSGGVAAGAGVKGMLNDGASITEVESDKIQHTEPLDLIGHFERIYVETLSMANITTLDGYIVWQPAVKGV